MHSQLGLPGQTTFLLPPSYGLPPSVYVPLLLWHIRWHYQFGVDQWLVYLTEAEAEILADPTIKVRTCT